MPGIFQPSTTDCVVPIRAATSACVKLYRLPRLDHFAYDGEWMGPSPSYSALTPGSVSSFRLSFARLVMA